jgi:hypothetical protein
MKTREKTMNNQLITKAISNNKLQAIKVFATICSFQKIIDDLS